MVDGDQFTAPLEETVAMDSPIQENQSWMLDMNTEVLDSPDYVEKLRDQTLDDVVEDSVKDIVLDSDEEGNEVLSITSGGLSLMETNRRNGVYTSEIDGGKHASLGYKRGKPGNVCRHSLQLQTSIATYQGRILASDKGISGDDEKISSASSIIYAAKDHQGWQCTEKVKRRSLAGNIRNEQTSAPTSCGIFEKVRDVPFASSHREFPSMYDDSQEQGVLLEEDALRFVDQFVSVNDLPLSEKVETGIAKGSKSSPTLRGKGVLTLMKRACSAAKAIKPGVFDWTEEETTKSNLVMELDEHCDMGSLGKPSEKDDSGTVMLETFDIGFNTQMAAEAMEALLYAEPTNYRERHEIDENNICSSPDADQSKKIKSKFCSYLDMAGSNSEITRRESEEDSNKSHGSTSGSFENQCGRRRKSSSLSSLKNRIICKEPTAANSFCEHPVIMKKNMNGRYSRVFSLRNEGEAPQRHKLKQVRESVESKNHGKDLGISSGATKRLSSMSSPEIPKDPILSIKRKRSCKLKSIAHETKRKNSTEVQVHKKQGIGGKYSKLGTDVLAEVTNLKRTLHNNVSDLKGTTSTLELDLWSYPKRKRTHRNVARYSNEDCKPGSWFPVTGQDNRIRYPTQNRKTTKWMDGLVAVSELKKEHSTRRRHSVSFSKHKSEESWPGPGNCESAITTQKTASMELDEGMSARESCRIDGTNSISSVVYMENCILDAVMEDNKASETSKSDKDCKKLRKTILSKPSFIKELTRLGYNNSLPDFLPREARRQHRETARVLFSQHLGSNIINHQKRITARLGFSVASCCSDATHFITDRFLRTRNMLLAMASGKPVVTPSWLESCGRATYHIDEKYYILRDAKKEKEIGFSMSASLGCAKQHPLLKGRRVFITPNIKPGKELIQSLVKSVQGEVIQRVTQEEDKITSNDVLILSCEEDYAACVPFLDKGAAVYDPELLLNGIVIQKLEYERHQLFTNYDENKGSKIGKKKT